MVLSSNAKVCIHCMKANILSATTCTGCGRKDFISLCLAPPWLYNKDDSNEPYTTHESEQSTRDPI